MGSYLLSITKISRSAKLYVGAFSAVAFAYIGIASVLGNLYVLGLGFDTTFLGTMIAVGQLVWALAALPAGEIGARFGLRGTIITGYGLLVLFYAIYLNISILPEDLWAAGLMISNIGLWATVSLISVNGVPYLMAVTEGEERSKAFAFQAAVGPLAGFLGSLVGGFLPSYLIEASGGSLSEVDAYRITLMIAAMAYLISVLLMLNAQKVPSLVQSAKRTGRHAAPIGLLVFLGVMFGVQVASEGTLINYLNVYFAKDLLITTSLIGTIFAVVRLMPFFLSPLLPLVFKRWGVGLTMSAAYVLIAISALVMGFFQSWVVGGLAFLFASIAVSFAMPSRSLFGQEAVLPRWRTTVNAVMTISFAAGGAFAFYVGGRIIAESSFQALFLLSAGLAALSVGLYAVRPKKKFAPPEEAAGPAGSGTVPSTEATPAEA